MIDPKKGSNHIMKASNNAISPNFCYITCYITYKIVIDHIPTRGWGSQGKYITCYLYII